MSHLINYMAKQTLNNKESTLTIRNKINANFTELFDYDTLHTHGNITNAGAINTTANLPLITTTAGVITTGTFGSTANTFCQGNDSRLSDTRTPSSHAHGNITNAGAINTTANLPLITTTAGVITTGTFGSAENTFCQGNDVRLSNARTPLSHTHGNITNAGTINTTANLPLITTTAGVITTGTFGSTANTFCQGNDSRLSDARTPLSHTHDSLNLPAYFKSGSSNFLTATVGGYSSWWNFPSGLDPLIGGGAYDNTPSNNSAVLSFSNALGPKINLYGTTYGLGVDSSTFVCYKPTSGHFAVRNSDFVHASNTFNTPYMLRLTSNADLEILNSITAGKCNGILGPSEPKITAIYDDNTLTQIIGQTDVNNNAVFQNKISNVIYSIIRANGSAELRGSLTVGRANSVNNGTESNVTVFFDNDNYTRIQAQDVSNSNYVFQTRINNVVKAAIRADGYLYSVPLAGTGTRAIYANADGTIVDSTSDERLKENISPINNALDKVKALKGVYYNWKDKETMGTNKCVGLIAQEVQKIIPEAVFQNPATGYYGVQYAELVSVLINAINELVEKIEK